VVCGHNTFSVNRNSSIVDGGRPWASLIASWTSYAIFGDCKVFSSYHFVDNGWYDSDGRILTELSYDTTINYDSSIYVCGTSSAYSYIGSLIGNVKYSYDGVDLFDYVPVVIGDVGAFYDRVSERIIEHEGEGTPIPGPIVSTL
jgi:hypothetical protein